MSPVVIIQGAEYYLPVTLKVGDTPITADNADDVKIQLCGTAAKKSEGMQYGTYTLAGEAMEGWLYPLTEELTLSFASGQAPLQAWVKMGDAIIPFPVQYVTIDPSIGGAF